MAYVVGLNIENCMLKKKHKNIFKGRTLNTHTLEVQILKKKPENIIERKNPSNLH